MDFTQWLQRAGELATTVINKYGPVAWDTLLTLKVIEGLQLLVLGGFGLVLVVVLLSISYVQNKKYNQYFAAQLEHYNKPTARRSDAPPDETWRGILAIVSLIIAGFSFVISLVILLNIWNWIAVFKPELAIAHDIMTRVVK